MTLFFLALLSRIKLVSIYSGSYRHMSFLNNRSISMVNFIKKPCNGLAVKASYSTVSFNTERQTVTFEFIISVWKHGFSFTGVSLDIIDSFNDLLYWDTSSNYIVVQWNIRIIRIFTISIFSDILSHNTMLQSFHLARQSYTFFSLF